MTFDIDKLIHSFGLIELVLLKRDDFFECFFIVFKFFGAENVELNAKKKEASEDRINLSAHIRISVILMLGVHRQDVNDE